MTVHTIRKEVVARALRRLRAQKTHTLFAGYLHLQQRAAVLNRLKDLQPKFLSFFDEFFLVPDHPLGTPYIKPFEQSPSDKNLWLNRNVAGTYAPSSLRPNQPFRRVVNLDDGVYSLYTDHAARARRELLTEQVRVADLAVFLYRDYGFTGYHPSIRNFIDIFAYEFGYSKEEGGETNGNFNVLYSLADAETWEDNWTEVYDDPNHSLLINEIRQSPNRTSEKVRKLTSNELLQVEAWSHKGKPPLRQLVVGGLLSFAEKTIFDFGRLNILVGPNGSGKSNLFECVRILCRAPLDIQSSFRPEGFEDWLNNGLSRKDGSAILRATVLISEAESIVQHQLTLGPLLRALPQLEELVDDAENDSDDQLPYFSGSYRSHAELGGTKSGQRGGRKLGEKNYDSFQSILSQIRDKENYPEITGLADFYTGIRIYSEWASGRSNVLREASSASASDTQMSENLNNLPSVFSVMERTSTHEHILKLLSQLKETYRDYITRVIFGKVGLFLQEEPYEIPVPARRLSDGTLHFLALVAILVQDFLPPLICLDEPELGMHPDMIRMLAGIIVDASQKTQLIISTHSEHLLTALQDNFDVLFAFNSDAVGSTVERLTRNDYHAWRADHALGELWSSGEIGGVRY